MTLWVSTYQYIVISTGEPKEFSRPSYILNSLIYNKIKKGQEERQG